MPRRDRLLIGAFLFVLLVGCEEGPTPIAMTGTDLSETVSQGVINLQVEDIAPATDYTQVERGEEAMRRLTRKQFDQAIKGLFGDDVVVPRVAEPDVARSGLKSIGASAVTYTPRGVESIEAAAINVAAQALQENRRPRFVPCTPVSHDDPECAKAVLAPIATRAWRRTPTADETDRLVTLANVAGRTLADFYGGLEYGIAAIIQSPYFLFRTELGEKTNDSSSALTALELASRLSFFLWNGLPDDALQEAAESEEILTREGLFSQAKRMLNDPKARSGLRVLFEDYFQLYELDHLSKDPTVFGHFNDRLGEYAGEETLKLLEDLVFENPRDFRELMTSRVTFINPMLAAIYDVPAPDFSDFGRVELPEEARRAGILGQVSFLAVHAHSRASSATRRGIAVRNILLCQVIPPAPVDVDTSIPEPSATVQTLRDRVAEHLENPSCAGCHSLTDPIGLGLENFDGLGRYRSTEYGTTIDPSGQLDGAEFSDAVELGHAIRDHRDFVPCVTKMLARYAIGRLESKAEAAWIKVLSDRFRLHGYQLKPFILELIMSPLFNQVGPMKEAE